MEKYKWPLIVIGLSTILIIILSKGKQIMEAAETTVWDWRSRNKINLLHPAIREQARQFLNEAEKRGIRLRVTSKPRTVEEQNKLYNQPWDGIDNDNDGLIDEANEKVTNAKGGQSFHNYGLAFDVVPMINNKAIWNSEHWDTIGQIGKSFGFAWGGDFKSINDRPHFQLTFGFSWKQLLAMHNAGNKTGDYLNLA